MYNNYNFRRRPIMVRNNDDRLIGGGFLAPFLLGGITGGLLAPAFYNPRPYYGPAYYNPYPTYYQQYTSYPVNYYYY